MRLPLMILASTSCTSAFTLMTMPRQLRVPARATAHALIPPEFASEVTSASNTFAGATAGGEATTIADVISTLFLCLVAYRMVGGGLDASKADDETKAADQEQSRTQFGWLQADLRIPLPTLADLRSGCHLIGQHDGHHMYLCSSRQPEDESATLTNCKLSDDFTTYYGTQVFVCQGPKSEMSRL